MIFALWLFVLVLPPQAEGQNWNVRRHYTSNVCGGSPYQEDARNGGSNPCGVAQSCAATASFPPDYTVVECTGTAPSNTISPAAAGVLVKLYTKGSGCAAGALQESNSYAINTCIPLASGSVKVICTSISAERMVFSDTNCQVSQANVTLAVGLPDKCLQISLTDDVWWHCDSISGATPRLLALPSLILVLMVMIISI